MFYYWDLSNEVSGFLDSPVGNNRDCCLQLQFYLDLGGVSEFLFEYSATLNTQSVFSLLFKLGFVPEQTVFVSSVLGDETQVGFKVLILN